MTFDLVYRHFQKAGNSFTKQEVLLWAKRPLKGKDVFLASDAYFNYGSLCEDALMSVHEVLKDEWNIPKPQV